MLEDTKNGSQSTCVPTNITQSLRRSFNATFWPSLSKALFASRETFSIVMGFLPPITPTRREARGKIAVMPALIVSFRIFRNGSATESIFRSEHQPQTFQLPPVLRAGGQQVNSGGFHAGMAQNIRQFHNILVNSVINRGKQVP